MVHHISYFINNLISNIMVHTSFQISDLSLQLLPNFLVVYYDEKNYPIGRFSFDQRDTAVRFFRSSINLYLKLTSKERLSNKVFYIRMLSLHCIDDVYQYTSSKFYRVNCH